MQPKFKLYCGDCVPILKDWEGDLFDVVITSPPYNVGKSYSLYEDNKGEANYINWLVDWISTQQKTLNQNGSIFLNLGHRPKNPGLPIRTLTAILYNLDNIVVQNVIIWVKSLVVDGVQKGHFKPINSQAYLNDCFEYIFHLTHGAAPINRNAIGVPYSDKTNLKRWKSARDDLHCAGNVWFIPYRTIQNKRSHPSPFPAEIPRRCLRLVTFPEQNKRLRVLDPFMGSGTTGIACLEEGHYFIGIEIDPHYVSLALARMEEMITNA